MMRVFVIFQGFECVHSHARPAIVLCSYVFPRIHNDYPCSFHTWVAQVKVVQDINLVLLTLKIVPGRRTPLPLFIINLFKTVIEQGCHILPANPTGIGIIHWLESIDHDEPTWIKPTANPIHHFLPVSRGQGVKTTYIQKEIIRTRKSE